MTLKRTTVMVDEEDLRLVKEAARRQGKPEAELIREAFRLIAASGRIWSEPFFPGDVVVEFAGPISRDDVKSAATKAAVAKRGRRSSHASAKGSVA